MPSFLRNLLLVSFAVGVVAAVVFGVHEHQRTIVDRSFQQGEGVNGMLTGVLDQETALRGYLQTGERSFLEPYGVGRRLFAGELARVRRHGSRLDAGAHSQLDRAEELMVQWTASADERITRSRIAGSREVPLAEALERKTIVDELRALIGALEVEVDTARSRDLTFAQRLSVALIFVLALAFGVVGWFLLGRPAERDRRARRLENARRDRQNEFARTMQIMDGEQEAHGLVKRHLERTLDGAAVTVLQRNNSADRLRAVTELDAGTPLAVALVDAQPRSCLAVRLGSEHVERADSLLACELCGKTGTALTRCTPLVVSGEVIGSVLVGHDGELGAAGVQSIEDTVTQSAPVIANMRNLAIAEERAATDALTGLANRRSVQDTVRRMVAHAQRAAMPLAVLAIDIDNFKRINDRLGHDRGDDVLAAVGQTLAGALRASDFVGRQGGEEFVALLPDTDLSGALTAAENLRAAIEGLDVLGPGERVTASFGIAVQPEDGTDGPTLMRQADRALYAAKANGRNRVETAASGVAPTGFSPEAAG